MSEANPDPGLSLVVPVRDEAGNIAALVAEVAAVAALLEPFELVFVDDGSGDETADRIVAAARSAAFVRLVRHDRPAGQSAAIHSGVGAARGGLICTLDGDGQNPPAEIPRLLRCLEDGRMPAGVGLVAGQRVGRNDTLGKRWGSRLANGVRSWALGDGIRDTGCGMKLFRRDAFLALPYFDHMHRFLPALFARDGWAVRTVDVADAPRRSGKSKYGNLGRALVGIHDLFGVAWLLRRRKKARFHEQELSA